MAADSPGAGAAREEACPRFCPGCHGRALSPVERLAEKQAFVSHTLYRWRDRLAPVQEPAPGNRRGYREKVCLSAGWSAEGWRFGLNYRRKLIPIHNCPLHSERVNKTIALLSGVLPPAGRFPLVYYLQSGGQVTLVVKTRDMPDISWISTGLAEELGRIGDKALWLHLHPAAGRRVTAKNTWRLVWGEPRSTDVTGLVCGPTAFQQLIPELSEAALDAAEGFLAPGADDLVLDMYGGIGNSLRRWIRHARRVIGVEIHAESVACARVNAPAATIFRGAVRQRLPQLTDILPPDDGRRLLYANPPRAGIEPQVLAWITDVFTPSRMACLSCNAVSLKRDLERLTAGGYGVEEIISYDFFPETRYLEMLALLIRK